MMHIPDPPVQPASSSTSLGAPQTALNILSSLLLLHRSSSSSSSRTHAHVPRRTRAPT